MIATKPTIAATATLVNAGAGVATIPRQIIVSVPTGGSTVYFGGPTVTSAAGFPVVAGGSLAVELVNEPLYAITASGTQAINVLATEA